VNEDAPQIFSDGLPLKFFSLSINEIALIVGLLSRCPRDLAGGRALSEIDGA
jgi:hypothetical protein